MREVKLIRFLLLLICLFVSSKSLLADVRIIKSIDATKVDGTTITALYGEVAVINAIFEFSAQKAPNAEKEISDIKWTYKVTANSTAVTYNPKSGTGNEVTINASSKKTGTYKITIEATVTYKVTKFKSDGVTVNTVTSKTETGSATITLIVKHPDAIQLVDAHHVCNYAPMDMTGKWGIGKDELLIGVENNNKIKLKFVGLDSSTTYTCIAAGSSSTTIFAPVTNDTPFEIGTVGNSEIIYALTLKDSLGNEAVWNVRGFPLNWRNARIDFLKGRANWGWTAGYTFAYNLLNSFLTSAAPTGSASVATNLNVADKRLTHNCGAYFSPTTKIAPVQKYTFAASSDIANKLSGRSGILGKWAKCIASATVTGYDKTKYPHYPSWLNAETFDSVRSANFTALKAKFNATTVGNTFTYTFSPQGGGVSFEKSEAADMYYSIHSCNINFNKIEYTYTKKSATQAEANRVAIQATITDIYDFDYGGGGTGMVASAATVQIGAMRGLDLSGKIFLIQIDIDKSMSDLRRSYRRSSSSYYHVLEFP